MYTLQYYDTSRILLFDTYEKDDVFVAVASVSGLCKDDVSIEIDNGSLTITCNFPSPVKDGDESVKWISSERLYGKYMRRFDDLGDVVDIANVTAEVKNGLLTLRMPKSESSKKRKVDVNFA